MGFFMDLLGAAAAAAIDGISSTSSSTRTVIKYDISYDAENFDAEECRESAESGYDLAQVNLALHYFIDGDVMEGTRWLRRAAEQKNALAQALLANCYRNGDGVEKDYHKAFDWYRKAAAQGLCMAQSELGCFYEDSLGVKEDLDEAIRLYKLAATQGDALGLFRLGECYMNGWGGDKDEGTAVALYQKAAEQGSGEAKKKLDAIKSGSLADIVIKYDVPYDSNDFDFDKCLESARSGYEKAQLSLGMRGFEKWLFMCAKNGMAAAQSKIGDDYSIHNGGAECDKAAKWYSLAAAQGDANGQYGLGGCYNAGCGVEKDTKKAVALFLKSAEQGNVLAQAMLGDCYKAGRGTAKDYTQAAKWYSKAAEQGYTRSQTSLGYCYLNGLGVEKDYDKATEWLFKAAEHDDGRAMLYLGDCYRSGWGVERNTDTAAQLYERATYFGRSDEDTIREAQNRLSDLDID